MASFRLGKRQRRGEIILLGTKTQAGNVFQAGHLGTTNRGERKLGGKKEQLRKGGGASFRTRSPVIEAFS